MTGPEHYREAERLAEYSRGENVDTAASTLAEAQVHATLALAAATALNDSQVGLHTPDWQAWHKVAGVKPQ